MATTSYKEVLQVAAALPRDEQLRLVQELVEHTRESEPATSVMELCGLGQEIWQRQHDAQEYVNGERASWNG
ncbi:MAG TPA: hypothetical protein VGD64_06135 [Acidisarcina sp.]